MVAKYPAKMKVIEHKTFHNFISLTLFKTSADI